MAILEKDRRPETDGDLRRFTVDEYRKMGEVGILGDSDELIDGVVMVKGAGKPWRWTCEDFQLMGASGILEDDERVELIEGEVITLAPIGPGHRSAMARMTRVLIRLEDAFGPKFCIFPESPVMLSNDVKPQPDIVVAYGSMDDFEDRDLAPSDLRLVVEVSDTSLAADRTKKYTLYAQMGIPEYWIINLQANHLEVYRQPTGDGYAVGMILTRQDTVEPLFASGVAIAISDFLPAR